MKALFVVFATFLLLFVMLVVLSLCLCMAAWVALRTYAWWNGVDVEDL